MKVLRGLKARLRPKEFKVTVAWDPEAHVWYVSDSDVPGLSTEAESVDNLIGKLRIMIPELLVLNGLVKAQNHQPSEERWPPKFGQQYKWIPGLI